MAILRLEIVVSFDDHNTISSLGKDLVAAPAERLKEAGIALFCIGIEPDSETPEEIEMMREEMMMIASEPTKQHVFMSDGYHELQRKVHSVSQAACVGMLFTLSL